MASIERLGADLDLVIKAVAPGDMPVLLVGHSMGGMTIMALACEHPGLFGTKVTGVALISTAASGLSAGQPMDARGRSGRCSPGLSLWCSAAPPPATGPCWWNGAAGSPVTCLFSAPASSASVDPQVHPAVVDFLEQMIRSTPIEVVAAFGEALYAVDMRGNLPVLGQVPVITLTGGRDRLISPALGLELAESIPGAELVWVPGAGHALILEY